MSPLSVFRPDDFSTRPQLTSPCELAIRPFIRQDSSRALPGCRKAVFTVPTNSSNPICSAILHCVNSLSGWETKDMIRGVS